MNIVTTFSRSAAIDLSVITKMHLKAALAVLALSNVFTATSAYAHSRIHCQFDFVAKCKANGGSHAGCFGGAPSVCVNHTHSIEKPGYKLTPQKQKSLKVRRKKQRPNRKKLRLR